MVGNSNLTHLVYSSLMAAALKFGFQKDISQFCSKAGTDYPAAEAKNISIIVKSCIFSTKIIGTTSRTYTLDFICRHRHTYTGSAAQNTEAAIIR